MVKQWSEKDKALKFNIGDPVKFRNVHVHHYMSWAAVRKMESEKRMKLTVLRLTQDLQLFHFKIRILHSKSQQEIVNFHRVTPLAIQLHLLHIVVCTDW